MRPSDQPSPHLFAQRVLLQMERAGALAKGPPIRIDDVARGITQAGTVEQIRFRFVDTSSRAVMGFVSRTDRIADIVIDSKLDKANQRFVACRELSHVLLAEFEANRVSSLDEVTAYIAGLSDNQVVLPFSAALQAEIFAEICAMEILCPYAMREPLFNDEDLDMVANVASLFQIPSRIAEVVCSSAYRANAGSNRRPERTSFRIDPTSPMLGSDLQIMFQRNVDRALEENDRLAFTT